MMYDCIECNKTECAVEKDWYCPDCFCKILDFKGSNYEGVVFDSYFLERCNRVTTHFRDYYGRCSTGAFLDKLDEKVAEIKNAESDSERKTKLADIIMTCIACWGNMMKGDYADTSDLNHKMRVVLKKIEGRLADVKNSHEGRTRNDRF